MLTAILVQIQEFGEKGEDFLKSWGVKPLSEEVIEEFKADETNQLYLQAGYYIGLTKIVEYMDIQKDGGRNTFGARETVNQIARNLGIGTGQVRNSGAVSDSIFISVSLLLCCMHTINI